MIDKGEITEDDANKHPYKHVITRVLGIDSEVSVEISEIDLSSSGKLLLCSDGLSNMLSDDLLEEFLRLDIDVNDLCDLLVAAANERGGNDNITVVVAEI